MLRRSLRELALAALLGGERMAAALAVEVSDRTEDAGMPMQSCREALCEDLDRAWPGRFRLNELEQVARLLLHPGMLAEREVPAFEVAFDELMQLDGPVLRYRAGSARAFARLAVDIDPTLLAAWGVAQRVHQGELSTDDLAALADPAVPLFVPVDPATACVAENHAHLGGIGGDNLVVAQLALGSEEPKNLCPEHRDVRRRLNWLLQLHVHAWCRTPGAAVLADALPTACVLGANPVEQLGLPDWPALRDSLALGVAARPAHAKVDIEWLLWRLASAAATDLLAAWPWLLFTLCYAYQEPMAPKKARASLLLMLADMTRLRRELIMSGQGLRRFAVRYYRAPLREQAFGLDSMKSSVARDVARRLFPMTADRAELKVSPKSFSGDTIRVFAQAVTGLATDSAGALLAPLPTAERRQQEETHRERLERLHFCVHFLRPDPSKSRAELRKVVWRDAAVLADALGAQAGWSHEVFGGAAGHETHVFQPRQWLRALDVAGDETAWSIEYFAPALRWLRAGAGSRRLPKFHLSMHAGEDYAHPLSGMRWVDETLRFCRMKQRDRLGHALALGIAPGEWLERHGDPILSVDEHVDNLVWAWARLRALQHVSSVVARVLARLETRIAAFAPYVSWLALADSPLLAPVPLGAAGRANAPAPHVLAGAWRLRYNCPYQMFNADSVVRPAADVESAALKDGAALLAALRSNSVGSSEAIFIERARRESGARAALGASVSVQRVRGRAAASARTPVSWPFGEASLLEDEEDDDDVLVMEMLQDVLLERCRALEVTIEANPSSNVYIARIDEHAQHPLFRWNPPDLVNLVPGGRFNRFGLRSGPVAVLINTDDQGIIPTSLRGEFDLICEAATAAGTAADRARDWLDEIRALGVAHFERNHRPVFVAR